MDKIFEAMRSVPPEVLYGALVVLIAVWGWLLRTKKKLWADYLVLKEKYENLTDRDEKGRFKKAE